MKYRKKPVVIEAERLTEENAKRLAEWCGGYWYTKDSVYHPGCVVIRTLEGGMAARLGDYIIKGVKGEFYPCKPDIFEQSYEEEGDGDGLPEIDRLRLVEKAAQDVIRFLRRRDTPAILDACLALESAMEVR